MYNAAHFPAEKVWSTFFVTMIPSSFGKGYISKSISVLGVLIEGGTDPEGLERIESSLSWETADLVDLEGLIVFEMLEKAVEKPSIIVWTPLSFIAPDSDGKHTTDKAKQDSMYSKYRPAVEMTT
jgi:hypothetical protein